MNRKSFLRRLGLGAIVAASAPKVLAEKPEEPVLKWSEDISTEFTAIPDMLPIDTRLVIDMALIPDGVTLDEFIREWRKQNGTIIYDSKGCAVKYYYNKDILFMKREDGIHALESDTATD